MSKLVAILIGIIFVAVPEYAAEFPNPTKRMLFRPIGATHAWKYSRWASLIPCALVLGLGVGWAAMAAFLHTRASSAGIGEDRA
jgi:hypothetical protein